MEKFRKLLLGLFLLGMLAVIVLTWGSIGSIVMTMGLLLSLGFLAVKRFTDTHDPSDLWLDD